MITREDIFKQLMASVDSFEGDGYNVPDLLLSTLYIESIKQVAGQSVMKRNKWTRFLYRVKERLNIIVNRKALPNGHYDVVMWPAEYNHLKQMSGVYARLNEKGIRCIWVTNKKKIATRLKKYAYPFVYVPGLYSGDTGFAKELWEKMPAGFRQSDLAKTIKTHLKSVVSHIRLNEDLVKKYKPAALLAGNDLTMEGRIATAVFKRNNIFTACIQHGDMSGPLHAKHIVDKFFLYGNKSLEQVKRYDTSPRFEVTGAPYLEAGAEEISNPVNDLLSTTFSRYLLVAFSGPGNNTSYAHHQQQIRAVFELVKALPGIHVVIKLHPKDRLAHYRFALEEYGTERIRIIAHNPGLSIFGVLQKCDLLITGASMTAIEAMHLGIPVISVDFMSEYRGFAFIDEGATVHTTDYSGMKEAVERLLSDEEERKQRVEYGRKFAAEYFFSGSDYPSVIIAESILKTQRFKQQVFGREFEKSIIGKVRK